MIKHLNDSSLDLLEILELDVAPCDDTREPENSDRGRRNEHVLKGIIVRHDDSLVRRRADGVRDLRGQITVDGGKVGLGLFRQVLQEFRGEDASPDGAGDGAADATANAREHALDGQHDGDLLVRRRCHHRHLLADDARAAREGVDDLHEDDPA